MTMASVCVQKDFIRAAPTNDSVQVWIWNPGSNQLCCYYLLVKLLTVAIYQANPSARTVISWTCVHSDGSTVFSRWQYIKCTVVVFSYHKNILYCWLIAAYLCKTIQLTTVYHSNSEIKSLLSHSHIATSLTKLESLTLCWP